MDEISSNDTIIINDYLSSNDEATFIHPDWGKSKVRITRLQNNSKPIAGSYSITYMGKTLPNLSFYLEDYELERLVQQGLDAPTVKITKSGSCWRKNYDFEWQYEGGEKPLIITDGTAVTSYTEKIQSGYIEITELGPDFFRTPHVYPQISVFVNDYHAWCNSPNGCSYSFIELEDTPKIAQINFVINYEHKIELTIELNYPS